MSDDRIARLRQVPVLAGVGDDVLRRIVEASSELECPAGQVLISADKPGAGMFVLEEGTVVVEAPGRTIELGPGEFFGELSLLVPEATRAARVRAKTEVRCVTIDRVAFERLLDDEPRIARAMLPVIAERLWRLMRAK